MRHRFHATLFAALATALVLLPIGDAAAGPAKEFSGPGVKWTLPDDWSFSPVSSEAEQAGFFAKAECGSASVVAYGYAKATDGLSLDDRAAELKQAGGEGMGDVVRSKTIDSTLSGVKGKVVVQRIRAQGGQEAVFRKYVIVANGKFYQLIFQCWHDAHTSVTEEINAARAGFRLLKGAGKEDAPEDLTEVDDGGGEAEGGTDGGASRPDGWPAKGPKLEGRKVSMENHNFTWTLPKDSPFKWTGGAEDVTKKNGLFLTAMGRAKRKKKEFEKNTPDFNLGRMDLFLLDTRPGFKAVDFIKEGHAQRLIEKDMRVLETVEAAKTRTKDEVSFGNHKAAYVKFEGEGGGQRRVVMLFITVLRGQAYFLRCILTGHTDAYRTMAPIVGKALKGIAFIDTTEPVRGPLLIDTVPDYAAERGENVDKEREYPGPGFVMEKPKGLSRIKAGDSMNPNIKFAGEGRTEDGKAYYYVEIRVTSLKVGYGQPMPKEEQFIERRAQEWEAGAGPEADLGRGKKLKMKKGSFARARGLKYEFTGTLNDEPVVEQGYVVKHKQNLYFIKTQFIGKDAEKKLKDLAKDVEKGLKFSR